MGTNESRGGRCAPRPTSGPNIRSAVAYPEARLPPRYRGADEEPAGGRAANEGQCCFVALNTFTDGRARHFMPNCVQQRGKAASQLTLKNLHFRQFGYVLAAISQIYFKYAARTYSSICLPLP